MRGNIAEVRTEDGKLHMFVAVDRTSKFVFVELYEKAGKMNAAKVLRHLIKACPYKIHTILTDNGVQFTQRKTNSLALEHIFDRVCRENEIEHRLTKVSHPWTNGQVERMNRTLKEATVKRYHDSTHDQLREHIQTFVIACNFAKRLKTLRGLTVFEYVNNCWTKEPKRFIKKTSHHFPGLNN